MPTMEDFKRFVIDSIAVFAGLASSEVTATAVAKKLNKTGPEKVGIKALIKAIFAAIGFFGSAYLGGFASIFMFLFGVGALAGILLDLLELVIPGGLIGFATSLVAEELNRAEITVTSVEEKPLVRW